MTTVNFPTEYSNTKIIYVRYLGHEWTDNANLIMVRDRSESMSQPDSDTVTNGDVQSEIGQTEWNFFGILTRTVIEVNKGQQNDVKSNNFLSIHFTPWLSGFSIWFPFFPLHTCSLYEKATINVSRAKSIGRQHKRCQNGRVIFPAFVCFYYTLSWSWSRKFHNDNSFFLKQTINYTTNH